MIYIDFNFFKIFYEFYKTNQCAGILEIMKISKDYDGRFTANNRKFLSSHSVNEKS